MITKTKDPPANLDYVFDWTPYLNGDTIATSTWMVPDGLTKGTESKTNSTTVWISGGTDGSSYVVTNQIVTAAGRTDQRSLQIRVYNL